MSARPAPIPEPPGGQKVLRRGGISLLWRPRSLRVCLVLGLALLGLAIVLLGTGTIRLSPAQVLAGLLGDPGEPMITRVIQRLRLPRVLTALLVGAALGLAGAAFQSLSRNALGSPDVIGFTTGAATGAITAIILFQATPLQTALAAILSGMGTALAVLLLARRGGGDTAAGGGYRLILVGIGAGAILGGVNTGLMLKGGLDQVMAAQVWLAGSLNGRSWAHVWPALAGLVVFAPILLAQSRRLSLLEMGADTARQLGVRVGATRLWVVLAAVGLTSVATAATGPVAFIALAGPQIARRLTRAPGVPMVAGAMTGALLLMAADLLGQAAPLALNLPVGLTTGFLGGLYLIVVLLGDGRRR
ncbi:FecCD family ABC transporter permease [Marinibacterium sp. SX1]|uniref:FecCD family ABC transporter permease n=1 Tax=Marinibacterium sp. SX1 TaxID=3388424 RepID=UPI003D183EB3